jgi:hypothetical protein
MILVYWLETFILAYTAFFGIDGMIIPRCSRERISESHSKCV